MLRTRRTWARSEWSNRNLLILKEMLTPLFATLFEAHKIGVFRGGFVGRSVATGALGPARVLLAVRYCGISKGAASQCRAFLFEVISLAIEGPKRGVSASGSEHKVAKEPLHVR